MGCEVTACTCLLNFEKVIDEPEKGSIKHISHLPQHAG